MQDSMKKNIIYAVTACITAIMTGCSADSSYESEPSDAYIGTELQLRLTQESMTRSGMITSTSFQRVDSILVVVTDQKNPDKMTFVTKAVYINGKWIIDRDLDFNKPYNGNEWTTADVAVYYPYSVAIDGFDETTRNIRLDSLLMQEDILYGSYTGVNKDNPVADITCHHAMTCLSFALKNNSDNTAIIENIQIEPGVSSFVGYKGTLNSNGLQDISYDSIYSQPYYMEIPAHETRNLDLLLAPTELAYEKMIVEGTMSDRWTIILTINNLSITFPVDLQAWQAGTQYVYPVNLIADLPERQPNKIHMYDTSDGKHVYWSDINVGATSISDYGRLFGWGDPTGELISTNYDDYPSSTPPDDIAGTEYDMVAVNWGGKWRLPSTSDFEILKSKIEYKEWTSIDGVNGVRIISSETGYSLFFPVAPYRNGGFVCDSDLSKSYYWLSDRYDTHDGANKHASMILLECNVSINDPFGCNITYGGMPRCIGLPVKGIWIDD